MHRFVNLVCTHGLIQALRNNNIILTDVDECARGIDGCAQTCTNVVGSYSCSCDAGYRLASNRRSCNDINECILGIDHCAQTCMNTIGSYICICGSGYHLASDRQGCIGKLFLTIRCIPLSKVYTMS